MGWLYAYSFTFKENTNTWKNFTLMEKLFMNNFGLVFVGIPFTPEHSRQLTTWLSTSLLHPQLEQAVRLTEQAPT